MIPTLSHVYFTGDPQEFDNFMYYISDALHEIKFESQKLAINWIARHFRFPDGENSMERSAFSFQWWIGLLKKNARAQGLPISHAVSVKDKYAIPELSSSQAFMGHLQESFGTGNALENMREAMYALSQGEQEIQRFNTQFNALVYGVDLTETERCKVYEDALNVELLSIAIKHTAWREAKTLDDKQDLAKSASFIKQKLDVIQARVDAENLKSGGQEDQEGIVLEPANFSPVNL
ncbi:hypothetical protein VP01_436g9 [Puccinia sorghi]|uniref:Retrotransposon gag domain-containing protein n=1 Tax=Puccinia sorghi TaxID=27349 RepID=A0A0L6UPT1_9BASI|nr:hypothetical protein VP01_436g9 [Puccinia sorghi]